MKEKKHCIIPKKMILRQKEIDSMYFVSEFGDFTKMSLFLNPHQLFNYHLILCIYDSFANNKYSKLN